MRNIKQELQTDIRAVEEVPSQRAYDVYITSNQRRCNVLTLHRRCCDIVSMLRFPLGKLFIYLVWIDTSRSVSSFLQKWESIFDFLFPFLHTKILEMGSTLRNKNLLSLRAFVSFYNGLVFRRAASDSKQTHNLATTLLQRRCNVKTLQRRCNDVDATLCVSWVLIDLPPLKFYRFPLVAAV